jgi:hypothetical protein
MLTSVCVKVVVSLMFVVAALASQPTLAQSERAGPRIPDSAIPQKVDQTFCLARIYDGVHLSSHPDQLVTSMRLALVRSGPDSAGRDGSHVFGFGLSVTMRGRSELLKTGGVCKWPDAGRGRGRLECAVDCDSGRFSLEPASGADALLLRITGDAIGFSTDCAPDEMVALKPGLDDKVFRLNKSPTSMCRY